MHKPMRKVKWADITTGFVVVVMVTMCILAQDCITSITHMLIRIHNDFTSYAVTPALTGIMVSTSSPC